MQYHVTGREIHSFDDCDFTVYLPTLAIIKWKRVLLWLRTSRNNQTWAFHVDLWEHVILVTEVEMLRQVISAVNSNMAALCYND